MKHWKKWTALLLAGIMAGTVFTGCGKQEESSTSTAESSAAEESSEAQTEAAEETTEATTTTAHVSPTETVSTTLGTEIEVNATLDRGSDDANNYKAKLSNFIEDGDVVQSFTFIVKAADGSSNLADYKGGYGISVKDSCASATDKAGIRQRILNSPSTAPMRNLHGMCRRRFSRTSIRQARCSSDTGGAVCSRYS